jgi:hypothetical protein
MRIRRLVPVTLLAVFASSFAVLPSPDVARADAVPYASASETYYKLDTPNGRMSVRIHQEFQNMQSKDLATLPVYVLPGAENVVVKAGTTTLETKLTPGNEATAQAGAAVATLPAPLKPNLRTVLETTYDVPSKTGGKFMTLESGLIETVFIGQGPGSFVLLDVPASGDNYLDPGCLKATDQPKDVTSEGLVRWVCGEVTIIALNEDDPDVMRQCAGMDDKCRQRREIRVFSAYVQSVTDPAKLGKLEGDVTMPSGKSVHMTLKYFKREQAWADAQWTAATTAFPKLEALFGYPYPLDYVNMRESHHIGNIGAAGIAYSKGGEVLLQAQGSGDDREVTVHELGHQWALYRHFKSGFMVEGLAEFSMESLAPEMGISVRDWGWKAFPITLPLINWDNDLDPLTSSYFYGRSAAFWFEYEKAVGGREVMTQILGRLDDDSALWPVDAGWFMDQGEWVSGKNLDKLFMDWVYQPVTAGPLLAERRAAHDLVDALQARAATMGLSGMPSDIYDNLLAWVFDPIGSQVDKANKVLDLYAQVLASSTEAGLGTPDGVAKVWGKGRVSDTLVIVEEQRQAILAVLSATKDLEAKPEDSTAKKKLAEAREKYSAGDYAGAKAAAAGGVTAAYNEVAAAKMIKIAKDKQASFSPNFFGRIGMFFTDADGKLAQAEKAYAEGDGTAALKLSRSAYDTWDGASQRGIRRLAILAGVMCGLTFLVFYLLKRLEAPIVTKRPGQGHALDVDSERRSGWRDWENS